VRRPPARLADEQKADLCARLIERRELDRKRMSNRELGELYGVDQSFVSRFEKRMSKETEEAK